MCNFVNISLFKHGRFVFILDTTKTKFSSAAFLESYWFNPSKQEDDDDYDGEGEKEKKV